MTLPLAVAVICLGWLVNLAQPIGIPGVLEVGPADIFVKLTEECPFKLPSFVDFTMKLVRVRGKQILNLNATLPFKLSDKVGVGAVVAHKRAGQWRPNFFKGKGDGLCTLVKNAEKDLFDMIGKDLKAPEPYTCPLPAGKVMIADYLLNLRKFQKMVGAESLPYGEFKAHLNLTHKSEVVSCAIFYYDIVARQSRKKG